MGPPSVALDEEVPSKEESYSSRNAQYWKRNLIVCVFGSFTTLVSLTLLLPFLPIFVEELGVKQRAAIVEWSGLAFGATFLATGLTAPLWGHLADRFGRRPMLIRAAIGMAAIMPLIGLAHSVYELVLLRLAAGLVGGYSSASMLLIAMQTPSQRAGWALGILSTGALAGNLIGPLVGGILPGLIGIRHTFFAAGGMIAVAMIATILLVREDFVPAPKTTARNLSTGIGSSTPIRITIISMLATAMLVLLANMSIEPIITVCLQALHTAPSRIVLDAGLVMAASAFGSVLTAAPIGRVADRIGGWKVIVYCLIATGLVLIPQAFVKVWWQLAILRFFMGMTLAGLLPSIAKMIRHSVAEGASGKVLGYSQSAQFSGQVLGPLLGGFIGAHLGMRAVFVATSGMLLLGAGLNEWAYRFVSRTSEG